MFCGCSKRANLTGKDIFRAQKINFPIWGHTLTRRISHRPVQDRSGKKESNVYVDDDCASNEYH